MPTPVLKAAPAVKKAPAMMVNKSSGLARSAEEQPEEGSGTVLALTIIAALLVMTVVIAGLIGVVSANRRASAAADLSALAAADAYRGLTEGDPCAVAADLAERHGAHLESCTFPDRPETVEVSPSRLQDPWARWARRGCVPAPGLSTSKRSTPKKNARRATRRS